MVHRIQSSLDKIHDDFDKQRYTAAWVSYNEDYEISAKTSSASASIAVGLLIGAVIIVNDLGSWVNAIASAAPLVCYGLGIHHIGKIIESRIAKHQKTMNTIETMHRELNKET